MSDATAVLSPLSDAPLSLPEQEPVGRDDGSPTQPHDNADSDYAKQASASAQHSPPAVFSFAPPVPPSGRVASDGSESDDEDELARPTAVELEDFCLWLARLPVDCNHPRPLRLPSSPNGQTAAGSVLTVRETDRIAVVFDRLVREGFLGCPVLDADGRYRDQVDVLALVWFVCEMFKARQQQHYEDADTAASVGAALSPHRRWAEFFQLGRFHAATVSDVLFAQHSIWAEATPPCYPAYSGFSTLWVWEQMARLGCHRVPVLSRQRRVLGLVTQSMLLSVIAQKIDSLGPLRDAAVSEMVPALACEPRLVSEDSRAIEAFESMRRWNITGLGVVDARGSLVGCITTGDLRGVGCDAENFHRLWLSVRQFQSTTAESSSGQKQQQPRCCAVGLTDSMQTLIRQFDDGNVHHVFIVRLADERSIPLHVVTQRDVLRFLCYKMGMGPIWEEGLMP